MVDAMVNSVQDYLIDGLSFRLSLGASHVTDRRSVSYFTSGSNIYMSGFGTKVARINLTGDGWLDPSTVRLCYTLVNTVTGSGSANKYLRPLSGPWGFLRRARCMVGGAVVDDIDYYNRNHDMLHILTSKTNRDYDAIEVSMIDGTPIKFMVIGHQYLHQVVQNTMRLLFLVEKVGQYHVNHDFVY